LFQTAQRLQGSLRARNRGVQCEQHDRGSNKEQARRHVAQAVATVVLRRQICVADTLADAGRGSDRRLSGGAWHGL
jgi:hypothetical protein